MTPIGTAFGTAIASPWALAWGEALLHFVWEGALIGAGLAALQALTPGASPRIRYAQNAIALFLMPTAFLATALGLRLGAWVPALGAVTVRGGLLTCLVAAWAIGAAGLALRAIGGWMVVRRARTGQDAAVPAEWQASLARVRTRMNASLQGYSRNALGRVRLAASALVPGPCAAGWLRPVILLPLAGLSGMPAEHLEALLAHELAHIARRDYLVNLLQRGVEAMLFYHPAVWWISRQVSAERENCCDDMAIAACGDRLGYARALVELEAWRSHIALAAGGGSLAERVRRVLQLPRAMRRVGAISGGLAALALLGLGLGSAPAARIGAPSSVAIVGARATGPLMTAARMAPVAYQVPQQVAPAPVHFRQLAAAATPAVARVAAVPVRLPEPPAVSPADIAAAASAQDVLLVAHRLPGGARQMVVAYAAGQVCGPQVEIEQSWIAPATTMGIDWVSARTVMHCEPVLSPVGIWVMSL